jgi:glutamine synthetase
MLLAGIDGVVNEVDPVKEGFGPVDRNVDELAKDHMRSRSTTSS